VAANPPEARAAGRAGGLRVAVALLIVVLLVAFVVGNSERVRMSFIFFHANVRLIWVLLCTAILGALADRLVPRLRARRHRSQAR
jgi:uncharacterized integral membrane protein